MVAGQDAAAINSLQALKLWRDTLVNADTPPDTLAGCPLGNLAVELADTDPDGLQIAAAGFDRWRASIAQGLKRMHARGELRQDADPDDLATALLAALQGGLLLSRVTPTNDPLTKALDAMITLISRPASSQQQTGASRC